MFYQGAIAAIIVLLTIHLSPTLAEKSGQDVSDKAVDLCKADSENAQLCRLCASPAGGVTESTCCREEAVLDRCRHQLEAVRRKRDADATAAAALSSMLFDDGPRVSSRARPFLGKRARYMLGKRLRNNFLGKRADERPYADDELLMERREADDEKRAARPFLGKKARPFLGKRSDRYGDPTDQMVDAEREGGLQADKRARRPFLGKRARRPFLGKREYEREDDGVDEVDEKRARRPFLGKRAGGSRPFLGKRRDDVGPSFDGDDDDELMKRAVRYMLGKRADADVDVDGFEGVDAEVEAEKRRRYMLGKRSTDDGDELAADRKHD